MMKKVIYESEDRSILVQETMEKNDYFCNNWGMIWSVLLIFEFDRDIVKTKLCRKFQRDQALLSKVTEQTAGRAYTDRS